MALFKKKKEEMKVSDEIPSLPELPRLPELPNFHSDNFQFKPNALPRYPPSTFGNKFSQNTIKDAISGEKEGDEEFANESEEEIQTMPRLPKGPLTKEEGEDSYEEEEMAMPKMRTSASSYRQQKAEPMFVRLDKFEESLESFEKIKKQFAGVDALLDEIKRIKEDEGKELAEWQSRLQTMKNQIDKIDRDIFSKIE